MNHRPRALLAAVLLAFVLLALAAPAAGPFLAPSAGDLPSIPLAGHSRLLVLAPHCDDETLGAGGLIQAAIREGMEVRVVIATNGDGYLFATMEDFHAVYPHARDFIRMGIQRQQESLQALHELGVSSSQVIFLSYPDRSLQNLWNIHWSGAPYHSPYTQTTHSPYEITYNPHAVYTGESLLSDLRSIFQAYRPDLVVFPHPEDVHPDHWGLSAFTRLALAMEQHGDPDYHPDAYAYLVHRHDFPRPKGLKPGSSLAPPPSVYAVFRKWLKLDLDAHDLAGKQQAVAAYRSQLPLLHGLLESFVRRNELFGEVDDAILPLVASGNPLDPESWRDARDRPIPSIQPDPVRDSLTRKVAPASDLVALYAARWPDGSLEVCEETRQKPKADLAYTLRVLAAGQDGIVHVVARNRDLHAGWLRAATSGRFACVNMNWDSLGDPWLLYVGSEVEELGVSIVDQTAWQVVFPSQITP